MDDQHREKGLTVDDVLATRDVEVRNALVNVIAKVGMLPDKYAGGTTTLRSKVQVPWAEVDQILWDEVKRYM